MLVELRKVDSGVPDAGRSARSRRTLERSIWRDARGDALESPSALLAGVARADRATKSRSRDFDPDGEIKIVAAALYAVTDLPDDQLLAVGAPHDARGAGRRCCAAYVGERGNRRHRPGRAFERTSYRFDVLTDYGAFRDLQRHRLLTLDWQPLIDAPRLHRARRAASRPACCDDWTQVDGRIGGAVRSARARRGCADAAPYAVAMAYRVRFYMEMNAREAMHVIELRTAPQGHPAYRRVCQQMHRLIADRAGHQAIAAAMKFADHSEVELERLKAERELERKRQA